MKLIVSAADYAMTESITDGCIRAMRDGILTDVGLMTNNLKYSARAAEEVKKYPHVSVGMDINLVSGVPCTDPELIPTLVDENGIFVKSVVRSRIAQETGRVQQMDYDEVYLETENQVKRFIELIGHKPVYMNGHSYSEKTAMSAVTAVCRKYDIPWMFEQKVGIVRPSPTWYVPPVGEKTFTKESFNSADYQRSINVTDFILKDKGHILKNEYTLLRMHVGYTDAELYQMSTFHDVRPMEMSALCDLRIKKWVEDNEIELLNYVQFFAERPFQWE